MGLGVIVGFLYNDSLTQDNTFYDLIILLGDIFIRLLKMVIVPLVLTSIIIGISQAIAILPGISRSGATISTSVLLGVDKEKSARFSFLMVVPLILGKMAKDIFSGDLSFTSSQSLPLLFGFILLFLLLQL